MFRNPRENRDLPSPHVVPSTGRPPSPPGSTTRLKAASNAGMAGRSTPKAAAAKLKSTPLPKKAQTTLVPLQWGKKSPAIGGKAKPKPTSNGNIMAFFKKAEEINSRLFLDDRGAKTTVILDETDEEDASWSAETKDVVINKEDEEERYNENGGTSKRRKVSDDVPELACSLPHPVINEETAFKAPPVDAAVRPLKVSKKTGPFVDDSESEDDTDISIPLRGTIEASAIPIDPSASKQTKSPPTDNRESHIDTSPPSLITEATSYIDGGDFEDFEGIEDLEDEDILEGEEYDERRWMKEQQKLEMAESSFKESLEDPDDAPSLFPDDRIDNENTTTTNEDAMPSCPICDSSLEGLDEQEASAHVNACLDGKPLPLSVPKVVETEPTQATHNSKLFKRPARPARPGQENPFQLGESIAAPKSAFTKLMANHAEDAAWASAAASNAAARGKPSYERTCPFYKIMPGLYICVDAFRYGAVKGQNAYFLSHFHSDHYIGLTASWSHGPIYCSKVTGNLVRQQLCVDPKWVVDLDFEMKTEVPGTEGVHVTMISANHCPGSSLFLFEKAVGKGKNPKLQRVLHCGDFRACQSHIEHPLLRPDVLDTVSGKNRQQKLDVCYLDTTYLNPKYAFPPQKEVIQACADMCVSLNKERADGSDSWEQVKRERAGEGMVKFVRKESDVNKNEVEVEAGEDFDAMKITTSPTTNKRGRLLVIVGTYSIGKERICMGIAKALGSKIYAPPNKQKICKALDDPELNALLTKNPREAQVHMTPLFEIRADTLEDYLRDYRDQFSRAVGFRPSGWNYRPPNSRFTESPAVQTVLHSQNWKSQFSMKDLSPQRGSTSRASCFGVPYSEHSSFRELTMFCCALRIDKIIPTVNVANPKSREKMKSWCERWAQEKKKNGLFKLQEDGSGW
jgi:DNA cross-link repair 1A protein